MNESHDWTSAALQTGGGIFAIPSESDPFNELATPLKRARVPLHRCFYDCKMQAVNSQTAWICLH